MLSTLLRRCRLPGAIATALAALAPATAGAAEITIGSDLSAPATIARSDPNDIVWWPSAQPGATIESPVKGQAIIMRLKGGTLQPNGPAADPLYDLMRFIVLRPQPDGTWRTTWSSVEHRAPVIGRSANEHTVTTYTSVWPLCVEPGDRIGLVSVGGFDPQRFPNGLPYQVFGARQGTILSEFRAGGAITHGQTVVRPAKVADAELLLQVVIGTGADARPTCGGTAPSGSDPGSDPPAADPPPAARARAVILAPGRPLWMYDGRKVKVTVRCRPAADCEGTVSMRARGKRLGARRYHHEAGETEGVVVRLSRKGRRIVERAGRIRVRAEVTAGDTRTGRRITVRAPRGR